MLQAPHHLWAALGAAAAADNDRSSSPIHKEEPDGEGEDAEIQDDTIRDAS